MKRNWIVCLLSLVLVVSLGGCGGGGGDPPTYPPCPTYGMVQPSLISPHEGNVISSLQPMFEWAYPGYYTVNGQQDKILCSTEGFRLSLSTGPSFQDELGATVAGVPGFDSLYTRTWLPPVPLQAGRMYRWKIWPISQGVEGPVSDVRYFFTGPRCDPTALVAPTPLYPINNWTIHSQDELSLRWWYPDACLPDGYDVEISTSQVFDGSTLNGSMNNPSTTWGPIQPVEDCTRYFWRVQAFRQGYHGKYSQVYTFYVNLSGNCPAETYGIVQGTAWQDQCVGPGPGTPVPDQPPLGCVYQNGDELFTNQTYDPGEPGIPGLRVNLGQGACPSYNYRMVATGHDGRFNFYELQPGTYCVSIDSYESTNNALLVPGTWTYPLDAVHQLLAGQTITVNAGQDVNNVNFGWWFKYGQPWGSQTGMVFGTVWHDLCAYTPGDPVPDPLPKGCLPHGNEIYADGGRSPDEPGIPGVYVKLGTGSCPASGLEVAYTDENGVYHFDDLTPGTYCVRIETNDEPPNDTILLPGRWTMVDGIPGGETYRTVSVPFGSAVSGQDFGWDYDNLPASPTPTPVPVDISPELTLTTNANCRAGPDKRYAVVTSEVAGKVFPIVGKNDDGSWFFVQLTQSARCWFASNMGTARGDLAGLKIFYGPPLPEDVTDTPVPVCATHKDRSSCAADSACKWVVSMSGPGVCKAK